MFSTRPAYSSSGLPFLITRLRGGWRDGQNSSNSSCDRRSHSNRLPPSAPRRTGCGRSPERETQIDERQHETPLRRHGNRDMRAHRAGVEPVASSHTTPDLRDHDAGEGLAIELVIGRRLSGDSSSSASPRCGRKGAEAASQQRREVPEAADERKPTASTAMQTHDRGIIQREPLRASSRGSHLIGPRGRAHAATCASSAAERRAARTRRDRTPET